MVGDYISTSFTGDGKAHPVFSLAKAPDSGVNGSCYPNNTGCHQRLTSATFDITLPPPSPRVRTRREPIARGLHRHPEDAPLDAPDCELAGRRNRLLEPGAELGEERRVDRVRERILAVEHVCARFFEAAALPAGPTRRR